MMKKNEKTVLPEKRVNKEYEKTRVNEIRKEFERRQSERRTLESSWLLNMNFMIGNQYATIDQNGNVVENGKQYFWQQREVFNHIAPMIESRQAKLMRVRADISVRPASNDERDISASKTAGKILKAVMGDLGSDRIFSTATMWSEICGTVLYKVVWNSKKTTKVSQSFKGDIDISVCPPYEIYPDNLSAGAVDELVSIIHARAYPVSEIKEIWGVDVKAEDVNVFSMDQASTLGGLGYNASTSRIFNEIKSNHAIVIEMYEKPSEKFKNGRLSIIAGDKLLYEGELPYLNGADGKRVFPFIRQCALEVPASFFGVSLIERAIPVQRAYNAVKNRKHEFLNRISMGVLAVEDGSVDTDNLEEEGLSPGKILIYRQGSNPPAMLSYGNVPAEFQLEEVRLLEEFNDISGLSELSSDIYSGKGNISGYALSLIIEQDDTRLNVSSGLIRSAIKEMGKHILRLYKQFSGSERLLRVAGENGKIELERFSSSDLNSDDIVFDTETEISDTPATRKNQILEILNQGLLFDENGKLPEATKVKVLEILGFGNWEAARALDELHLLKAEKENLSKEKIEVEEVDDHNLHITQHIKAVISDEYGLTPEKKKVLIEHIRDHKRFLRLNKSIETEEQNG